MKTNALVRHYDRLGAEERFRLIAAAGARGDEAEQDLLYRAAPRITLSCSHHTPWAEAFDRLAMWVYMELQEEVARHQDAFERWSDASEDYTGAGDADPENDDEDEDGSEGEDASDAVAAPDNPQERPAWERMLALLSHFRKVLPVLALKYVG